MVLNGNMRYSGLYFKRSFMSLCERAKVDHKACQGPQQGVGPEGKMAWTKTDMEKGGQRWTDLLNHWNLLQNWI